jgi:hypothetical protein
MNNHIKTEDPKKAVIEIQKNHEDEYWSKKYDVSTEELKETGNNIITLSAKIIKAGVKHKSFA